MGNHDKKIIATIFQAERNSLFRMACYKVGDADKAKDIVQDLFVKVWNEIDTSHISDVKSYLYKSLFNACISALRESHRVEFVPISSNVTDEEPTDDFYREYKAIANILHQIPEEQRTVISLRTIGGKSFKEIADILGLPLATVKSRFRYGIDKLRKEIKTTFK